jgi:GT2 family glycosyltransferase
LNADNGQDDQSTPAPPKGLEPLAVTATSVTGMSSAVEHEREQSAEREALLAARQMELRLRERVAELTPGSVIASPLRLLRRVLFSHRFDFDGSLRSSDIQPVAGAPEGTWAASSHDPHFLIACVASRGWFRVRLTMTLGTDGLTQVYFDTGEGFNPAQRVNLPHTRGPLNLDRFVFLGGPLRAVRFDPVSAPGQFRIEHFSVTAAPLVPALCRVFWAKFQEIRTSGRLGRRMRKAAGLLLRGRFGEFTQKLSSNEDAEASDRPWYLPVLTDAEREQMRAAAARWTDPPLISVLLPVYNAPERYLRLAIESVLKQTYPHWELCIADDCSPDPHVATVIREYAACDKRIKTVFRSKNGNISAASNSALELATGQYVALLDHDDELAEQALYRAAEALMADHALDMIYSDEDKLTTSGQHMGPFFKPDWSPEYLLSCMYTCHLGVYRTALLRDIGGFRSEYDFAQDYDLVLRLTARTSRIKHIAEVLYHWRILPTSTASGSTAKPTAHLAAQRALLDYLRSTGRQGSVEAGPVPGYHRVRYSIVGRPRISIIIASACRQGEGAGVHAASLAKCVASIRRSSYTEYEILALHNYALPPASAQQLAETGARAISCGEALPVASMLNLGAEKAGGACFLFLHDDIEVLTPDWMQCLLECAQDSGVGVVGAKLLFPDGRLNHVGLTVLDAKPARLFYGEPGDIPGHFNSSLVHRNFSAVSAACLLTPAAVFRAVGGFTPAFSGDACGADYCLKVISSGKRVVLSPYAQLYHHEPFAADAVPPQEAADFQRRWAASFGRDPFFPALAQRGAGLH